MKVFISVDMEGISGLVRWADVGSGGIDFQRNRSRMTADANAAIGGAFSAGATEVIVEENHGVEDLCVLMMDEIDPRCSVIRGGGRPGATTMAGLDESVGVVLLVGHHGRAGAFPGIMAHTISYSVFKLVHLGGGTGRRARFFCHSCGGTGCTHWYGERRSGCRRTSHGQMPLGGNSDHKRSSRKSVRELHPSGTRAKNDPGWCGVRGEKRSCGSASAVQ